MNNHPMTKHEILLMNTAAYDLRKRLSKNIKSPEAHELMEGFIQSFCEACENDSVVAARMIPLDEASRVSNTFLRSVTRKYWNMSSFEQYVLEHSNWFTRLLQFRGIRKERAIMQEFITAIQMAIQGKEVTYEIPNHIAASDLHNIRLCHNQKYS